jgi:hypothetical protein
MPPRAPKNLEAGIVCSGPRLVNRAAGLLTIPSPRVDKPAPLVLNVHRERSRNRVAQAHFGTPVVVLSSLKRRRNSRSGGHLEQVLHKKEAVFPSLVSMSERAEPAPSFWTNTARFSPRAQKSTRISPVRNLVGRSKTRVTGGGPPPLRLARLFRVQVWRPNPSPPLAFRARCMALSFWTRTTKSSDRR